MVLTLKGSKKSDPFRVGLLKRLIPWELPTAINFVPSGDSCFSQKRDPFSRQFDETVVARRKTVGLQHQRLQV